MEINYCQQAACLLALVGFISMCRYISGKRFIHSPVDDVEDGEADGEHEAGDHVDPLNSNSYMLYSRSQSPYLLKMSQDL